MLIYSGLFSQNNEVANLENLNAEKSIDFIELENDLTTYPVNVQVVTTCSTNPNLCGTMAFASASLVKILNGKRRGEKIYILALCKDTNYEIGKTYKLTITKSPNFGVGLCDNIIYDRNWKKSDFEKTATIFGDLN